MITLSLLFILVLILPNCYLDNSAFKKIDFNVWKSDKSGCLGLRENQFIILDSIKDKFYGIHEQKIFSTFGNPNKIEMEERNKKCYTYFMGCDTTTQKRVLKIDFDGLDRVRIIRIAVE